MFTHSRKPQGRIRDAIQKFIYWLGPLYCVLLGSLLLAASFVIQLLTSIGVPYIKSFDFFRFDFDDFQFVELGMWAACAGHSSFDIPTQPGHTQPEEFSCPPAMWGWDTTQYSAITQNFFHHTLPKALIFHPISCCFTFFALTTALVTLKRKRHHWTLPLFSFLSCFFALISFVIDVATFVPAKHKLESPNAFLILGHPVVSTQFGPAFWLSLATFCSDSVGNFIIISGYTIWRYQRISRDQRRRNGGYTHDIEVKAGSRMTRRGYFANDSDDELGPNARADAAKNDSFLMSSLMPSQLAKRAKRRKQARSTSSSFHNTDAFTSSSASSKRRTPTSSRAVIGASAAAALGGGAVNTIDYGRRRYTDDPDDIDELEDDEGYASSTNDLDERSREAEKFDLPGSDGEEDDEDEEDDEGDEDDDEEEEELASTNGGHHHDNDDENATDDVFSDGDAMSAYADARSEAGRSALDVNEPYGRSSSPFAHERAPSRTGFLRRKPVEPYYDDDDDA